MISYTINNFRIFRPKKGVDLYDSIDKNCIIISLYEEENQQDFLYFNYSRKIQPRGVVDLEVNDLEYFSKKMNSDPELILGLIKCAYDEDEDALYSYINKNSGNVIWINIMDEPIFRHKGALDNFDKQIGVLVSTGEMELDKFDNNAFYLNGREISICDLMGHYEEQNEFLILFKI